MILTPGSYPFCIPQVVLSIKLQETPPWSRTRYRDIWVFFLIWGKVIFDWIFWIHLNPKTGQHLGLIFREGYVKVGCFKLLGFFFVVLTLTIHCLFIFLDLQLISTPKSCFFCVAWVVLNIRLQRYFWVFFFGFRWNSEPNSFSSNECVSSISYVRPERTRVEKMMAVGLSFNSECVQSMMRRQINMTYSVWKSLNDEEKVFILIFSVF